VKKLRLATLGLLAAALAPAGVLAQQR